jgi:hypothetical protein
MATSLAHDVGKYCNASGSAVFYCSLDVEGAFDGLTHAVLLQKAMGVIPESHWMILYYWYSDMMVSIRWNNLEGNRIKVECGTRQGGLTSPYLFNLFYHELIAELNMAKCGVTISDFNYNVFCYADDILLCSTTSSGLQQLINISVNYVSGYGLRFNPSKTVCMISGRNPFIRMPTWNINGEDLAVCDQVKYLGTTLGNDTNGSHVEGRIKGAQNAFYSLQGGGLKFNSVLPETSFKVYNAAVKSVLLFGCSAIHLTRGQLCKLDKVQSKMIKCILGIGYTTHTTPILQATDIPSVSDVMKSAAMGLLRSCVYSNSLAGQFYSFLLHEQKSKTAGTLLGRVQSYVQNNIDVCHILTCDNWKSRFCLKDTIPDGVNGVIDSIRAILLNYNHNGKTLLNGLLKAY